MISKKGFFVILMKYSLLIAILLIMASTAVSAKSINISEIQAHTTQYKDKSVVVEGNFLYAEPMRSSFTIDQNGSSIEILYSDLSSLEQDRIKSLKDYSKVPVTVTGAVRQYANKAGVPFLIATAISFSGETSGINDALLVSLSDILADPSQYRDKMVSLIGTFAYSDPVRESLTLNQNGSLIEVFYPAVPVERRRGFLSISSGSKQQVAVTGVLREYANKAGEFFLAATAVELR